jgi:23S rRNA G2069 N7-methylase RlmK/C1962 C5-methylase RlmI
VYAAAGGAVSTDSVDLSNTYLAWARENFSLNGFSAQLLQQWDFFSDKGQNKPQQGSVNRLVRADVIDFLGKAAAQKKRWDIIILDPPSFSNSKKMTGNFDLQRDKIPLVRSCLELLAPGGKMFISINTRKHKESTANVVINLNDCSDNLRVTNLTDKMADEDFKGKKIPMTFLMEI